MNQWLNRIAVCSIAVLLSSCITMPGPDPARQAALDARFTAKSDLYPSKGTFNKPIPLAVGQYIVTGNTSGGRRESISKMAIVGKENNGLILEITSTDARSETAQQILVRGLEQVSAGKAGPDTLEILWIKMRDDKGNVQKFDGPMLTMMAAPMRSMFAKMYSDGSVSAPKDGGAIRVPAGTFNGTSRVDSEVRVFGMTIKTTSFLHPVVPISGVVRTESSDGKEVSELIDFGLKGATSSF